MNSLNIIAAINGRSKKSNSKFSCVDTAVSYFGAREYVPTIGRWTTKDPIGFNGGDTNLYAYVGGDPMSRIDPHGLFAFEIGGTLGGFLGGGFGVGGAAAGSGAISFNNSNPSKVEVGTTLSGQVRPIGVGVSAHNLAISFQGAQQSVDFFSEFSSNFGLRTSDKKRLNN